MQTRRKRILALGWTIEEIEELIEPCQSVGIALERFDLFNPPATTDSDAPAHSIAVHSDIDADSLKRALKIIGCDTLPVILFVNEMAPVGMTHLSNIAASSIAPLPLGSSRLRNCINFIEFQKQAGSSLSDQQEMTENFQRLLVKTISHEFNTPLGVVNAACHMLSHYGSKLSPEETAEQISDIESASKRIERLIKEMLLHNRLENEPTETFREPVDIAAYLDEKREKAALKQPERADDIDLTVEEPLQKLDTDIRLLDHVVQHILENALKFSEPGQKISIKASANGSSQSGFIEIHDNGRGIAAADQPKLFEPFSRFGNEDEKPGLGLGLAIAKRCMDMLGGDIQTRSQLGEGSTFRICIKEAPQS